MYVHVIKKKITADFILYVLKLYITVYVKTKKLKNPVLFCSRSYSQCFTFIFVKGKHQGPKTEIMGADYHEAKTVIIIYSSSTQINYRVKFTRAIFMLLVTTPLLIQVRRFCSVYCYGSSQAWRTAFANRATHFWLKCQPPIIKKTDQGPDSLIFVFFTSTVR